MMHGFFPKHARHALHAQLVWYAQHDRRTPRAPSTQARLSCTIDGTHARLARPHARHVRPATRTPTHPHTLTYSWPVNICMF